MGVAFLRYYSCLPFSFAVVPDFLRRGFISPPPLNPKAIGSSFICHKRHLLIQYVGVLISLWLSKGILFFQDNASPHKTAILLLLLWLYSPSGPWPLFHFPNLYTVDRTLWTGDQPVANNSAVTHQKLADLHFGVLKPAAYSPDLAPSDYCFLVSL
jgi:hypothetical protein